jgi:3-methyladenine DNA glycosylase AlkD
MPRRLIGGHNTQFQAVRAELRALADPKHAKALQWYFKTGPGEYGEGDQFLGLRAAQGHALARRHRDLPFSSIQRLLDSVIHEERGLALEILVLQFQKGSPIQRKKIYRFYVRNIRRINNWDLVDLSAPHVVGASWFSDRTLPVETWVTSPNLWKRRIAILATFYFIRQNRFGECLRIAQKLFKDPEDLIHKALGWMLREVGKRDQPVLERFLKQYAHRMPRTTLRYAIERFPERKRKAYLRGHNT